MAERSRDFEIGMAAFCALSVAGLLLWFFLARPHGWVWVAFVAVAVLVSLVVVAADPPDDP